MINDFFYFLGQVPFGFWMFWITVFLGFVAWKMWVHYIQQDFISGIDFVLLEIIPPREVVRSPQAMELFLSNALYHWSLKGGIEEYWQGAVWFWFSLEIVSIEGQVHFYVRTPTRVRELIETQMYAQYPQAQIREVPDYTLAVDEISEKSNWRMWGCEFGFVKEDPYPIKTYVDFGLDEDPKEEYKVDPISPVIEFFGSLKKGEQAWLQIVITPSKKTYKHHGKKVDWIEHGHLTLEKVAAPFTKYSENKKEGGWSKEMRMPKWLENQVTGINAKISKLGFDTGIRVCYVATKDAWNMNNRRNIRLIFRQYANPYMNQFWRMNSTQGDAYGGIFSIGSKKVTKLADRMLHEYRERNFFHLPLRHKIFCEHNIPWPISPAIFMAYKHPPVIVLNLEEIATIWHFPGQILKVPTLERIESKEASPPPNLPS
ncbi:MAG: hypothetical protein KBC44_00355 [Candidatus Pacebacteria bacterium]|nr:hypothetical protein [Candidatus Paceibacterota bacterium]MDQ5922542.1 hypothetical protein [Patescibacteria group bacterium]